MVNSSRRVLMRLSLAAYIGLSSGVLVAVEPQPAAPAGSVGPQPAFWRVTSIVAAEKILAIELREGESTSTDREESEVFRTVTWDLARSRPLFQFQGLSRPCFCRSASRLRGLAGRATLQEYDVRSRSKVAEYSLPRNEDEGLTPNGVVDRPPVNYFVNLDDDTICYATNRTVGRLRVGSTGARYAEAAKPAAEQICYLGQSRKTGCAFVSTSRQDLDDNDVPVFTSTGLILDNASLKPLATWHRTDSNLLSLSVRLSPDGRNVAMFMDSFADHAKAEVYSCVLCDARTGRNVYAVELSRFGHDDSEFLATERAREGQIAFAPDGTTFALIVRSNAIQIRAVRDGKLLRTFTAPNARFSSLSFSADGSALFAGTASREECDLYEWSGLLGSKDVRPRRTAIDTREVGAVPGSGRTSGDP